MSNSYDFFGAPAGAATGSVTQNQEPTPQVDRFGMPVSSAAEAAVQPGFGAPSNPVAGQPTSAWQQPPTRRPKNLPLLIGAVVAVVIVAVGAALYVGRERPIAFPSTVAGFPAVTLTAAEKSAVEGAEHRLEKVSPIHDVTIRTYGAGAGQGVVVVAGRINLSAAELPSAESQFVGGLESASGSVTSGTVQSGGLDFSCSSSSAGGPTLSFCVWMSQRSLVYGEGIGLDAQSTADALAGVRAYAGLI